MSSLVVTVEYDDGDLWIGAVSGVWANRGSEALIIKLDGAGMEQVDISTASVYLRDGERLLREWISPNRREEKSGVAS